MVFPGCNLESALGKTPFGRIDISDIQTQTAIKDSGNFEIEIYKDQQLTQLIAKLAPGAILPASNVQPGTLTNMKLIPSDYRVQVVTDLTVSFTLGNQLDGEAQVIVRLPTGLSIPNDATSLTVELMDASTVVATVLPGNEILVPNVVPAGTSVPKDSTVIFKIAGIKN